MIKKYGKETLSGRLKSTMITTSLLALAVGGLSIAALKYSSIKYDNLFKEFGTERDNIGNTGYQYMSLKADVADWIMDGEHKTIDVHLKKHKQLLKENLDKFMSNMSGSDYDEMKVFEDLINEFLLKIEEVESLARQGKFDLAIKLFNDDIREINDKVDPLIDENFEWYDENGPKEVQKMATTATVINLMVFMFTAATVGISIMLGTKLRRDITNPVNELVSKTERLSHGDLSVKFSTDGKDEMSELSKSLARMTMNLNGIVKGIRAAAIQVNSGSKEISNSAQVLSEGSTEQASAVEQLTASVEQISAQTEQNAKNAVKAREFMLVAKEGAISGNELMGRMVTATEEIQKSSNDIANIIKVIDDIAFQTKMLALNANVEAARAGQHGKGFAVVADEVKNLAVRSADAVKETTQLIEGSIRKAEVGTELALATAESLKLIVNDVTEVTDLVSDIANASSEQALGIQQINIGISQVSDVVQTTSATAEQSASSSQELAGQAETLNMQVGKFKLRDVNESANNEYEEYNPEVFSVIEGMGKKGRNKSDIKIDLDDDEFGKYM